MNKNIVIGVLTIAVVMLSGILVAKNNLVTTKSTTLGTTTPVAQNEEMMETDTSNENTSTENVNTNVINEPILDGAISVGSEVIITGLRQITVGTKSTWTISAKDYPGANYIVDWDPSACAGLVLPYNRVSEGCAELFKTNQVSHTFQKGARSSSFIVYVTNEQLKKDLESGKINQLPSQSFSYTVK